MSAHILTQRASYKLLSALLGLALCLIVAGDPLSLLGGSLMIDGDYANAAAAYSMFVREGWHWPLGANPNFGGVNVFYSDAAPWFALLGKAIYGVSGIELLFHALVVINLVLIPILASRLMAQFTSDAATHWLGVALISFSLIMPVRIIGAQHIALGSYWVVLWAMSAVPFPGERSSRLRRWEFVAAIAFAIWSHAYLAAMSASIILAQLLWLRQWGKAVVLIAVPLGLLYAIGALSQPRLPVEGAQLFAFDLLAYGQSLNWGVVPPLYPIVDIFQNDTIVYLGTGVWFALIVSLPAVLARRIPLLPANSSGAKARLAVLLAVGAALVVFAMAFAIRIGGPVLWSMPIPSPLVPIYESFRAVGRFAGVLAYALMILVSLWLGALARVWRVAIIFGILAICLQVADARNAGLLAPPPEMKADVGVQTQIVEALLAPGWSGRVYRDLNLSDMQEQRLLDYLLVIEHGATWFGTAHGARLLPEAIAALSDYSAAIAGDLVITTLEAGGPDCSRMAELKIYRLCVI